MRNAIIKPHAQYLSQNTKMSLQENICFDGNHMHQCSIPLPKDKLPKDNLNIFLVLMLVTLGPYISIIYDPTTLDRPYDILLIQILINNSYDYWHYWNLSTVTGHAR